METVKIYFDGGSNRFEKKAYGSYEIHFRNRVEREHRFDLGWPKTSNEAEYLSLLRALEKMPSMGVDPFTSSIEIFSDSELVVCQLQGTYRVKSPKMKPLHQSVIGWVSGFVNRSVKWRSRSNNVKMFGH